MRLRLHIHGRVQGVFFRQSAQRHARSLGLAGWVRNCADGSVEAVAEGEESAVRQFGTWARSGPSMAEVERVDIVEELSEEELATFRIID